MYENEGKSSNIYGQSEVRFFSEIHLEVLLNTSG